MRYKERKVRLYLRGDAAFASIRRYTNISKPRDYSTSSASKRTRFSSNIAHLLTRPVGRPPDHVRRFHASFSYQAGSWNKKRRVVAKVEWHPGELFLASVSSALICRALPSGWWRSIITVARRSSTS